MQTSSTSSPIITQMRQTIFDAGVEFVWEFLEPKKETEALILVGRIADDQPLSCTHRAWAEENLASLIKGLGAAAMLTGAVKVLLAVREDYQELRDKLSREIKGTRIELRSVAANYPLCPETLLRDLNLSWTKQPAPLVLEAPMLVAMGRALEGEFCDSTLVTVAGAVRQPGVFRAALGTPISALVAAAGGAAALGAAFWRNGLLNGKEIDGDQGIDQRTQLIVVLEANHAWRLRQTISDEETLRRAMAACANCHACTDHCPRYLNGHALKPQAIMRELMDHGLVQQPSQSESMEIIEAARYCTGCQVCDVICPARLNISSLISQVKSRFGDSTRGVTMAKLVDNNRMHRRLASNRFTEMIGLSEYRTPPSQPVRSLVPEHLIFRPGEFVVTVGEKIRRGDFLTLPAGPPLPQPPLRAPLSGRVIRRDADDGLWMEIV